MRRILIVPVLLIVAAVRIVFHIAAGLLFLPYSIVKAIADGAGAILKKFVKGEFNVKAKQAQSITGSVTSDVTQDERPAT